MERQEGFAIQLWSGSGGTKSTTSNTADYSESAAGEHPIGTGSSGKTDSGPALSREIHNGKPITRRNTNDRLQGNSSKGHMSPATRSPKSISAGKVLSLCPPRTSESQQNRDMDEESAGDSYRKALLQDTYKEEKIRSLARLKRKLGPQA